ncbi:flagellar hook-basal body complex protein FliE [Glaciimonas sp. Gout2]|uniref:flagellar hook-basal body complex protein FliE n=1 Tax=unclassified Glaciimonas TaxID=2644401 RepID=UPI002AB4B221|nr:MULTISPECIES: flagellar hook-basal body complex protein FliE [unclassified Glaciimonas]MDY7548039.1 flagellar hook-basal body complex protein FliE [Glaciimonas sp. CA11.2]MEB0010209.1 flagellar hook-basal body complex protein FliE [Glaciimonas sp. Cout2]MEB0083708.1 flagellar hook-basal body complex protein FliE [Glaciimonas sp. Gout2]
MAIAAIESVLQQLRATAQVAGASSSSAANPVGESIGGGFAGEMKKSLERISNAQTHAMGQAESFELGKPGVALNDVMVDLQKANVGFQMGLQVRNKVVSAYQEIMNLPA